MEEREYKQEVISSCQKLDRIWIERGGYVLLKTISRMKEEDLDQILIDCNFGCNYKIPVSLFSRNLKEELVLSLWQD